MDDNPRNNAYEIAKLQGDGFDISTAESTEAALTVLEGRRAGPALIISDMGRREGAMYRRAAGIDLIRAVRDRGLSTPIIVYTSDRAVRRAEDEVLEAGGDGITSSPLELFSLIEQCIEGQQRDDMAQAAERSQRVTAGPDPTA